MERENRLLAEKEEEKKKKKKKEKENTRDRSVPHGSDKNHIERNNQKLCVTPYPFTG